jgi:hypothetical protein
MRVEALVSFADIFEWNCAGSLSWSQLSHDLMDVAPRPGSGRHGAHDGVLGFMKVPRRVFSSRGVAAADVTASPALAKSDPQSSFRQTFLASVGCFRRWKVFGAQPFEVLTNGRHELEYSRRSRR